MLVPTCSQSQALLCSWNQAQSIHLTLQRCVKICICVIWTYYLFLCIGYDVVIHLGAYLLGILNIYMFFFGYMRKIYQNVYFFVCACLQSSTQPENGMACFPHIQEKASFYIFLSGKKVGSSVDLAGEETPYGPIQAMRQQPLCQNKLLCATYT